jgi:hypothetical protein
MEGGEEKERNVLLECREERRRRETKGSSRARGRGVSRSTSKETHTSVNFEKSSVIPAYCRSVKTPREKREHCHHTEIANLYNTSVYLSM